MTRPVVYIDCETTSLRHDKRAWEVALIAADGTERSWFIRTDDLDLGNADPASLTFGRFYDRHPQHDGTAGVVADETTVLRAVERMTRGAVLHGSNPSFDMDVLGARMRANGICPSWHYHPVDVPSMTEGWLRGRGLAAPEPAKSDALSLACGVDPANYDRHTAIGDCRWMRDLHWVITGATP